MPRPRKGSIDEAARTVAALHRGGLGAIQAAEELLRGREPIQVRMSPARKALYTAAAKKAGLTLSAWVLRQLDAGL